MTIILMAALLASAPVSPKPSNALPTTTPPSPPQTTKATAPSSAPPVLPPHAASRRSRPSAAERRVLAANRAATLEPATAGYVAATQVYPFSDGAIFRVLTSPGQVTDIALQPGETLGAVAAGDTVRWVIGDTTSGNGDTKRTHVLVKPFTAGLTTNIIVTTDRRTYHISLTSFSRTAMVAVSWLYPQDQLIAFKAVEERARAVQPIATGLQVDQLHFGYVISGDQPPWRPRRAFDDGRQTFIEFPPDLGTGEAPPLFLVDAKGTAQLINYRVQGRYYVVDRLFDAAELRLGLKHQDVVRITRTPDLHRRVS